MPSVRLRPGLRTVYLDTSTLIDALRARHPEFRRSTDPPTDDLLALVERISRDCNLCVSTMHIAELACGPNEANVEATFAWLDSLDLVWMYSLDKLGDREDERAVQLMLGIDVVAPVEPFAPSMLSAFEHWKLDSLSEVLRRSRPIEALAEGARIRGRAAEHALIDEMFARVDYDRHSDPEVLAMTHEQKADTLARKRQEMLEQVGARAFERLRGHPLPEMHQRWRSRQNPCADFAAYVMANPTALPSTFVAESFMRNLTDVMARRRPGSRSAQSLRSSFYDYAHLGIGAVYCDVFTCNGFADECLGDAPTRVGRAPPIVFRDRDVPELVRALERAAFAAR